MNKANVQKAIDIMTRVRDRGDELDMGLWQHVDDGEVLTTEDQLHSSCGTSACLAGWIAVSPEWKAYGGTMSTTGAPTHGTWAHGAYALAEWFDREHAEIAPLCGLGCVSDLVRVYPYAGHADDITVDDVITALTRLRDTGSAFV